MSRRIQSIALSVLGVLLIGCSGEFKSFKSASEFSSSAPPNGPDDASGEFPSANGKALYQSNCAACHGVLESSAKRGRNADQIRNAFLSIPSMASFKVSLSLADVDAIAKVLNESLSTAPPFTDADEYYSISNPSLYAAGRKYFPSDEIDPAETRLFRLTQKQIDVTAKYLLPQHHSESVASKVAKDPLQTNYEYADNIGINSSNFSPLTQWIDTLALRVKGSPSSVINCTSKNNSVSCLQTQARMFVIKAFRGAVTEAKTAEFVNFFIDSFNQNGIEVATSELVDIVFNSPHFLYRKEINTSSGNLMAAPELLQNLTYTLADAPPDKLGLVSAQASGYVQSDANKKSTIDTIVASQDARDKLMRFFLSWLEVKEPKDFTISDVDFPEFSESMATQIVNDTKQFLNYQLAKSAPRLKDITQSTQGFVNGSMVQLNVNQRLGIFSQPSVIASHSGPDTTRLVKRGVFWVRKVMCMEMEPPPSSADTIVPTTMETTERNKIETLTNQASCIGCHSVINPFGFFQEAYDPIGRWRATDNGFPIDTNITTNILDEGPLSTDRPAEALKVFTDSVMFKQCFVRQVFRFYMGRDETEADHVLLREMFYRFADQDNQDIVSLIQMLANSEKMSHRR